jgi:predicted GNAT family acetyltransferase
MTVDNICEKPDLPKVHALLCTCFDEVPSLNAWYPDVSHRLRHNCAQIATIWDANKVVSTAMTVAESDGTAILGQVATHNDYRGRGYAQTCIKSLISRCKGKSLYILPMTEYARSLYEKMGFVPDGAWAELQRI